MIIQDVINIAKYSELGNLAIKDNTEAVVSFINLGLIELYTRFPIKTEEYAVSLVSDQTDYTVPTDFMYATKAEGDIDGNTDPYTEIPINDTNNELSITFPHWKLLKVPVELQTEKSVTEVTLTYVSKPSIITSTSLRDDIELPDTLIDALISYIGYRAHVGVRGDQQAEGSTHWQRFERNCKKARDLGVAFPINKLDMSERVSTRGFV